MNRLGIALVATFVVAAVSTLVAHAFCGFYVAGSNQKLFNDATQVVLMRDGTRTVLAMQNDYRGPLEDFAMVVPVPVVLKESDVQVVEPSVFEHVEALDSPRLVEYWEQDPCPPPITEGFGDLSGGSFGVGGGGTGYGTIGNGSYGTIGHGAGRGAAAAPERPAIAPVLASFSASPPSITANQATAITWKFAYSNQPWPEPRCTIDHGVGEITPGAAKSVMLDATTTFTLVCANSAGQSRKDFAISAVKIEANFNVAEYQILILSATEATGLEQWLQLNHYKIPDVAGPLLRPYIESGSKFFVAKVDAKKVKMVDGHVALSPLRFHYDTDEFSLPIRLGLANSSGKQDLIVHVFSPDKRYEVANYKNVYIPTNFDVRPGVKQRFGEFYAALFDATIAANPRAVVTEYAWTARPNYHCDPCTNADVANKDLVALGADLMGGKLAQGYFVLTRLHARYGKSDMKDDLRFREAKPVTGGREEWTKQGLEYGAVPSEKNFFQARYAIRHWWTGAIACKNPQRNVWGGPPDGAAPRALATGNTAFAPRGKLGLAGVIGRDLWEIGFKKRAPQP